MGYEFMELLTNLGTYYYHRVCMLFVLLMLFQFVVCHDLWLMLDTGRWMLLLLLLLLLLLCWFSCCHRRIRDIRRRRRLTILITIVLVLVGNLGTKRTRNCTRSHRR